MKNNNEHLPVYGVGPIYGICIIAVTVIAIVLSCMDILSVGKITALKLPFIIIGILIAISGFVVWFKAAFKIDKYIVSNELCTDGIYGIVRNPCYSGIMLMCTGSLFIANNLLLLILPFVYWIAMTILMKHTEEKWLYELYGKEYTDYCKKVNRCIPWFARKK
ncbi:MAG: isoprenylcysteine carboxylmethyltransferase family protein [Faecalibacterium sp.]|nr:isoprenylcysteine carboxylmethyltransferase family protein [Ruminococcus sp.]MCM1392285.1 isoprenylcysteine carboxylmethyltransferase family protein [Ruminococcus sp.]MCM1486552.1 isoprenylcysteine carboxylmethyltransferase family protein [Faecalibacterium sp.]